MTTSTRYACLDGVMYRASVEDCGPRRDADEGGTFIEDYEVECDDGSWAPFDPETLGERGHATLDALLLEDAS